MPGASWLTWAIEQQNWFFGAVGAALIFYMGRGCVSIISKRRRQPTGHSANTGMPNWLAYTFLILSTGIPSIILVVVIIVHIIRAVIPYGIREALVGIETIVFIVFVATGFLFGLVIWGIMRIIMWSIIELFDRSQPRQDDPERKGKRLESIQDMLIDILRKGLFPDRRIEVAVREAIGKDNGRILVSDLEGLTKLDASKREVIDLSGMEHCINLEKLNLYSNQIRDIGPLSNLTELQELVLTDGGLRNIRALSNLTKLQRLRLGSNFVDDVSPLSGLINLRELYLWGNRISNIVPLRNLTNLRELGLGGNQIRHISALKSLTNLEELVLTDNWIVDITLLSDLPNLQRLYLAKNQISNISPLVDNPGMGEGTVVDLMGNPLNDEAYDIHIPALQERGVRVQFSPKL